MIDMLSHCGWYSAVGAWKVVDSEVGDYGSGFDCSMESSSVAAVFCDRFG